MNGSYERFSGSDYPRDSTPLSITDAPEHLYALRGRLFETELVEQFIQYCGIYPIGSLVELDTGEIGVVASSDHGQRLHPKLPLVRNERTKPYYPTHIIDLALLAEKA